MALRPSLRGLLLLVLPTLLRADARPLQKRLRQELRKAEAALRAAAAKRSEFTWQSSAAIVEASRCSSLLRARLRPGGPVVDVAGPSMITAWLLREGRVVIALPRGNTQKALAGAPGLVELPSSVSLGEVLEALKALRLEPSVLFLESALFLASGDQQDATSAARRADMGVLSSVRGLFPDLPIVGAMLNDEGREVPHWAIPSLIAPLTGSNNAMMVDLPCWAAGGCPASPRRPLLALVMIVKNEERRIRETVESVSPAVDRVVILDTGSTDRTKEILRETCSRLNLPLDLFEESFVDFSTTRNRVLQLAGSRTEFVLMLSGDETLVQAKELRTFVEQHSGYCGGTEDVFNVRVLMGPNAWYWSERLLRADNHVAPGWPDSDNSSWRYVGVTHEAYINPNRTMGNDLFIHYVGDTDAAVGAGMPAPVAGSFYVSHDAEKSAQQSQRRLRQDVHLLEGYLDKPHAHEDRWQYARAVFYLAQSHRSLGNGDVAKELWERYLSFELSAWRQFSYLRYGAHLALGQICAEEVSTSSSVLADRFADCQKHFEEAHRLCPRAEPLVYLALALPEGDSTRLEALQRAEGVLPMQTSSGHCAVYAEPAIYAQLPELLRQEQRRALQRRRGSG